MVKFWSKIGQHPVKLINKLNMFIDLNLGLVVFFGFIRQIGFKNSGLTSELRVLVGIGRSVTLRGRILS